MLISYRDSKRYPSDPLALKTWVRVAEVLARQVVCSPQGFDALQFARALDVCRSLTVRKGPEAVRRIITACASAGVAVVVVPAFEGCHASSASKWLSMGTYKRAMIALSLRYRRDDQLYFSLFREAGAILLADRGVDPQISADSHRLNSGNGICANRCESVDKGLPDLPKGSLPDRFARTFLIPPEYDARLAAIGAIAKPEEMAVAITRLAEELGIAPGLVVGRLQHDLLIGWKHQNHLKREVDLSYVLEASEAAEETWPDQATATGLVRADLNVDAHVARERVRRAAASGLLLTNGAERTRMRFEPGRLAAWRLLMRNRDLDAEDREEAA